jgi:hypothetical protein
LRFHFLMLLNLFCSISIANTSFSSRLFCTVFQWALSLSLFYLCLHDCLLCPRCLLTVNTNLFLGISHSEYSTTRKSYETWRSPREEDDYYQVSFFIISKSY